MNSKNEIEKFDMMDAVFDLSISADIRLNDIAEEQSDIREYSQDLRNFTKSEVYTLLGIKDKDRTSKLKIFKAVDTLGVQISNGHFTLNLFELEDLIEILKEEEPKLINGLFERLPNPSGEPIVSMFYNQKGGVGKTTSTLNIASMIAMLSRTRAKCRILLVDGDNQGSLSTINYLTSKKEEEIGAKTIGACLESVMDENLSDNDRIEIIKKAILPTSLPNVDIMRSSEFDSAFEVKMIKRIASSESNFNPCSLLSKVFKLISSYDEYDFIFIDCPPAINYIVYNCLYATDYLNFVITPDPNDELASLRFIKRFPLMINVLQDEDWDDPMRPLKDIKILLSNVKNSLISSEITKSLQETLGEKYFYKNVMPSKESIKKCAKHNLPVAGVSRTGFGFNATSYTQAYNLVDKVSQEIYDNIIKDL